MHVRIYVNYFGVRYFLFLLCSEPGDVVDFFIGICFLRAEFLLQIIGFQSFIVR